MSYRIKLQLAFLALGFAAIGIVWWQTSQGATAALQKATFDRLTASRRTQAEQLERWFQDLGNHTLALAGDETTVLALLEFHANWTKVPPAPDGPLAAYYKQIDAPPAWFPTDPRVRALQHHFLAANPYPDGEKQNLLHGPGEYGRIHSLHHPTIWRYQSVFGFYDVLLIEAQEARVVYSVYKEFDLGVSLREAPAKNSALATIYERAMQLRQPGQYVLQDYRRYEPSHGAPAAFLAAPVWFQDKKIGVLAIQVASTKVNELIAHHGLGRTGRISIVGPDGRLRSGDKILQEEAADFRHDVAETEMGISRQGRRVLRSHERLRLDDIDWALMAEIDEAEAFAPVRELQNRLLAVGALVAMLFLAAAGWIARSVTRPVLALAEGAQRLGQHDFGVRLPVSSRDEIGQLAESFNRMAENLDRTTVSKAELELLAGRLLTAQEDERQRVAQELHDDVSQRLAAAAITAGLLGQGNPAPELRQGLEKLRQQIANLSRDIHGLSRRLHPKMLDDLGLVTAIETEGRALFERGGPVVQVSVVPIPVVPDAAVASGSVASAAAPNQSPGELGRLPKAVELALYRIVQEGLRNVERHAAANSVQIRLEREKDEVHLSIADDGRGFVRNRTGLGLASMEERARWLGGRFSLESKPGEGTRLQVWLPVRLAAMAPNQEEITKAENHET